MISYPSAFRYPAISMSMIPVPGIKAKMAIAPILATNYFPGLKALKEKAALIF